MKLTSPLYSFKAWGSVSEELVSKVYGRTGSGVFRRESSYTQLEKKYSGFNPQTSLQQSNRSLFSSALYSWQSLPDEEKSEWKHFQKYRRKKPVMDGYNLYVSRYILTKGPPTKWW